MMVLAFQREQSIQKTKSFHLKRMFEVPERQVQSLILDSGNDEDSTVADDKVQSRSYVTRAVGDRLLDYQYLGSPFDRERVCTDAAASKAPSAGSKVPSDMELLKEKFAKLLLGEDMSGGGKGVSSALALSNAITNLAASVFGEQKKLEPMSPETKARWRKEIDWLLSVTDHIVELVPSQQSNNGVNMEIMVTRQRNDLLMNIPALRKLDAILVDHLDQFANQNEFWYVSKDSEDSEQETPPRNDDKWWIPTAKVPPDGLSDVIRRWLQFQKDSVNQVLKAAMAINAQVLLEMAVPENYIESLPKNGRASLGDSIYKSITVEYFDPEQFLSTLDLSSEHKVLDIKNRIEASIIIWKRKMHHKDGKSSWGSAVSLEKRELFEERAETILLLLKQRFPGIPQSALDISKIQYNKARATLPLNPSRPFLYFRLNLLSLTFEYYAQDVGQAVLESYSRIIESLAFTILSRIEDVMYADSLVQKSDPNEKPDEDMDSYSAETPTSMTLSDFMGWNVEQKCSTDQVMVKPIATPKKSSYLERLENLSGLRSPTAQH